jgi:hypothetical protein
MPRHIDACKSDLTALKDYISRMFQRDLDHAAAIAIIESVISSRIEGAILSRFKDWPTDDLDTMRAVLADDQQASSKQEQRKRGRPSKSDLDALEG